MVVERLREAGFEYRSRLRVGGVPLLHVVRGVDPASGRRPPAIGVIAVGQVAMGVVAIGQLAVGVIAVGQLAIGALAGLGQVAFALFALGQIAGGTLGAVGQAALGLHGAGIVRNADAAWTLLWIAGALAVYVALSLRDRRLGALLRLSRRPPTAVNRLDDGVRWIRARIVSENTLRAPLSDSPCAHWEALRAGGGVRTRERGGERLIVADDTGVAEVALDGATLLIRNGSYSDRPAPDWTVQMESFLTKGEEICVAGAVTLAPNPEVDGLYRGHGLAPRFEARADTALLVSTDPPAALLSSSRFARTLARTLVLVSVGAALAMTFCF